MAEKPEVKGARPNIRQRRAAAKLKAWRAADGRSTEDVAKALRWSAPKLNKLETCRQIAGPAEIIALATILGVPEVERDRVVTWALKGAEGLVWWTAYADGGDDFLNFVATEDEATTVRNKESLLVPGLAQTEAMTDALVRAFLNEPNEALIERRRALRRRRQERVTSSEKPLNFEAVIYEDALTQPWPRKIMAPQLDHLRALGELSNVSIQLLPRQAPDVPTDPEKWIGPPAGFESAYHLMSFEDEDEVAAVYMENLTSGLYMESAADVEVYTLNFERLAGRALDPIESARRIEEIRRALT